MIMTREQQIEQYMKSLKISREEAEQLYEDDQADFIGEEGEEMTSKAKEIRRYEKADEKKVRKPRERKVDEEKGRLLRNIKGLLEGLGADITSVKTETEISFNFNGSQYSVKLTKHRPPKK
jgi:transcription antitermination factor NusG